MMKYLNVWGFFSIIYIFLGDVPRWECLIVKPKSHVFSYFLTLSSLGHFELYCLLCWAYFGLGDRLW